MYMRKEERDILVIGSSTTAGTGPSSPDKVWVNRVIAACPTDNFSVFAEGGTDVDDWASDIGAGLLPQNQDIVVLQLGINLWLAGTAGSTFEANLHSLMLQIRFYHPLAQVYFLRAWMPRTVFDSQLVLWDTYRDILTAEQADLISRPFTFIDSLETNPELFYMIGQGIHYNDEGHKILADKVLTYLG